MKRNLGHRTQVLRGLADSLDIVRPSGPLTFWEMQNERKNRDILGKTQILTKAMSSIDESIDLVISPCRNAGRLSRLMGQLDETLHENDSYGSISRTTFSGGDTTITVEMQPVKSSSLIIKLAKMPHVEKVEERLYATRNFPNTFGVLPRLKSRPTRNVRIMLKDAGLTRQATATPLSFA